MGNFLIQSFVTFARNEEEILIRSKSMSRAQPKRSLNIHKDFNYHKRLSRIVHSWPTTENLMHSQRLQPTSTEDIKLPKERRFSYQSIFLAGTLSVFLRSRLITWSRLSLINLNTIIMKRCKGSMISCRKGCRQSIKLREIGSWTNSEILLIHSYRWRKKIKSNQTMVAQHSYHHLRQTTQYTKTSKNSLEETGHPQEPLWLKTIHWRVQTSTRCSTRWLILWQLRTTKILRR
jgi:hypothetical protein